MTESMFHDGSLLCPECGEPLHPNNPDPSMVAEVLCHTAELHKWPVFYGVPCLVRGGIEDGQQETVEAFSRKWDFDPDAVREERFRVANGWFLERFGSSWVLSGDCARDVGFASLLAGKRRILDAGCGLGNLTAMMARFAPHARVWGVDLSSAIFRWARKAPENVRLVRCDLRDLPISGEFDLIVSDGVLHHTPDTWESASALANRLAPGGDFLFHVYRKKAPVREFADDLVRERMAGMSFDEAIKECRGLASLGRQLREVGLGITIDSPIRSLGIEPGTYDLQRFIYWHFLKCFWDDGGNVNASIVENYDWYAPRLAHRHTEDEVRGWVGSRDDLELVHLTPCESGFSVHVRRKG